MSPEGRGDVVGAAAAEVAVAHDGGSIVVGEAAALAVPARVHLGGVVVRVPSAEIVPNLVREDDNVPHHAVGSADVVGANDAGAHAEGDVGVAQSIQVRNAPAQLTTEQGVDEVGT